MFLTASRHALRSLKFFGISDLSTQLKEYPNELLEELKKVEETIYKLASKGCKVRVVHSLSILGIILSVRHHLKDGFHVIVDKTAFKIENEVDSLVDKVVSLGVIKPRRKLRFKIG